MKLLLTSTGLSHPEISADFIRLLGKSPDMSRVGFITIAARTEEEYLYAKESKIELTNLGIRDIVTIDSCKNDIKQIMEFDVVYVCGGNTFHLMNEINKYDIGNILRQFVDSNKLYVGVSAGTIIVTPSIGIAAVEPSDANDVGLIDMNGLGLIDFEISPHTPEIVSYENVEKYSAHHKVKLYAISDKTAIKIQDGNLEVIGEKNFKVFN